MREYRILVAIDLKTGTDRLLAEAQRWGKALAASVDIIHVADPDPDFVGYLRKPDPGHDSQEDMIRKSRAKALRAQHRRTQELAQTLRASGIRVEQATTVQGSVLETILAKVQELNSDLLMLGSHHHGALHRLWYGDIVTDAAIRMPCALLVVPNDASGS